MGRQKPKSLPCFSPFCLSGSPPRRPVKVERLGARSGFKSHFHPLLTVDLRSFLLSLSLFFWKMRLKSTLIPRNVFLQSSFGSISDRLLGLLLTGIKLCFFFFFKHFFLYL